MKRTIAGLALALLLMAAFLPSAFASSWSGDPTAPDEEPYDILIGEDAPDDIYGDWAGSPATGDASSILLYAGMGGSALLAAGAVAKAKKKSS